ncbi:MAG TPA: twin-arginine translocase subunit TatC [Propionibacteriaceae bacterium]|nr:twin-arginine translocase subunit TatC [Propionibacteriaceae bacterium]
MALTILKRPVRFSLAWLKPPPVPVDGSMTLFEHLRELRYRLVVATLAIVVGMIVCSFFNAELFALLRRPYDMAIADLKAKKPDSVTILANQGLTSPFTLALKIALVGGMVISAPVWLWQLWSFIMPGLLAKEKKWALIFISAASPLFFAGVAVAYIVLPKGLSVLLGFTQNGITNMQDISVFLTFLLRIMVVFGVAFLIPLIVLMLNFLGVVKASQLAKYRMYVVFGTFVFGAVATPSTDPFSMLALALPMTLLFLAAEVIAHIADRRKARKALAGGNEVGASVDQDRALRELDEQDDLQPDRDG